MADTHLPHAGHPHDAVENPGVHHEQSDVDIRGVLMFAAGLIVVAVVIHIGIFFLLRFFEARAARQETIEYPLAVDEERRLPPEPRLQINPREDLQNLRTAEQQTLTTYGWVDRNAGIVRIPIDEAMKLTLQRGLPERKGTQN